MLSVDLPGMGEAGRFEVAEPSGSSVQVAVDRSLDWWNDHAYREGYTNPSNSSFAHSSAWSSQQAALEIGLNVGWASGSFAGQLDVDTASDRRVTMASFKQAFYTVNVDTPARPGAVFAEGLPVERIASAVGAGGAPAYVSSVTYGRMVLVRMETSREVSAVAARAALEYASVVRVDGAVDARHESILEDSSIQIVTLGGNADGAAELVADPSKLSEIIARNATYRKDNPGVPIGYQVRYLHDHGLARMGYTTEFTTEECTTEQVSDTITVTLIRFQAIKDCDGIEGDGDFSFRARVLDGQGKEIPRSRTSAEAALGDGAFHNREHEVAFRLPRRAASSFTVELVASEWDQDVFGKKWRDSRMDQSTATRTHTFQPTSGTWSNLATSSTRLGGAYPSAIQLTAGRAGSDCSAELHYVVDLG